MLSYRNFHASLLLSIVTFQCFGLSYQLSLPWKSTKEFRGLELDPRGERLKFKRSSNGDNEADGRIYRGTNANQTAYMISLQTLSGSHLCGGVILTPRFALSAGHCFDKRSSPASWRVVAGELNLSKDEGTEQVRRIKKIHIHPEYRVSPKLFSDIALLELDEPLNFKTDEVGAIEWKVEHVDANFYNGEEATAFGWGETEDGNPSNLLKQVDLPILTNNACRRQYQKAKIPRSILDSMICAGQKGSGRDACQGDSGGPLVVGTVLVGITSFGEGCGQMHAGVYTRVNAFTDWIESKINSKRPALTATTKTPTPSSTTAVSFVASSTVHYEDPTTNSTAFMLSLRVDRFHFCGCVILTPRFALTAARCFIFGYNQTALRVVAGKTDLSKDEGTEQVRGIKKIHIHPEYRKTPQSLNDLAIIELDEPFIFKDGVVGSVEWRDANKDPSLYNGEEATAFGWGSEGGIFTPSNPVLRKAELYIITNQACQRQSWLGKDPMIILPSMLCAVAKVSGRDTCKADAGGPLIVGSILVGIITFGGECAQIHAGVYTRVSAFLPWIESKIQ